MKPEDALEAARREAAARAVPDAELTLEPTERVTRERLLRFGLIEPDPELVYSTRASVPGRAITAVKQGLIHAMRQYTGQLVAQQTRFNLHAVAYITALEERIEALEAEVEQLRDRAP